VEGTRLFRTSRELTGAASSGVAALRADGRSHNQSCHPHCGAREYWAAYVGSVGCVERAI